MNSAIALQKGRYRYDLPKAAGVEQRPHERVELMPQYRRWAYGECVDAEDDLRGGRTAGQMMR